MKIFFWAEAIQNKLGEEFTLDFINRTLQAKGLSKPHQKKKKWGSVYMLYPTNFLKNLGEILLQIDFIWPRYLEGSKEPCHFLSLKYVRPFNLHIFVRIKSQNTTETLNTFYALFFLLKHPIPHIIQMDNDSVFRGFINQKGCIGRIVRWSCGNGIIPLFNAVSSPWNNWSVEWGNSVFDKKFWQKFRFKSLEALDQKLEEFNQDYKTYLIKDPAKIIQQKHNLTDPRKQPQKLTIYPQSKIYFLRIVKERYNKCSVEVLNYYINLPAKFKGQFVIIEVALDTKMIRIYQEIEKQKNLIYQSSILLNL